MQIQINTDHNIIGNEAFTSKVSGVIENALNRLSDRITRIEVHLSDENGNKNGQNDKRCMIEARLNGLQPVAVTDEAKTIDEAVEGAAGKISSLLESTLGRLHDKKSHWTDSPMTGEPRTEKS